LRVYPRGRFPVSTAALRQLSEPCLAKLRRNRRLILSPPSASLQSGIDLNPSSCKNPHQFSPTCSLAADLQHSASGGGRTLVSTRDVKICIANSLNSKQIAETISTRCSFAFSVFGVRISNILLVDIVTRPYHFPNIIYCDFRRTHVACHRPVTWAVAAPPRLGLGAGKERGVLRQLYIRKTPRSCLPDHLRGTGPRTYSYPPLRLKRHVLGHFLMNSIPPS